MVWRAFRQGMVWQGMVWRCMIWQGMVWQDMVWQAVMLALRAREREGRVNWEFPIDWKVNYAASVRFCGGKDTGLNRERTL